MHIVELKTRCYELRNRGLLLMDEQIRRFAALFPLSSALDVIALERATKIELFEIQMKIIANINDEQAIELVEACKKITISSVGPSWEVMEMCFDYALDLAKQGEVYDNILRVIKGI